MKFWVLPITTKTISLGLGDKEMICASHMMAACCDIENNLGQLITPLRACYNKAEKDCLSYLPDMYFQVVMAYDENGKLGHTGVYVGDDLDTYLAGAEASRKQNVTIVSPLKKSSRLCRVMSFTVPGSLTRRFTVPEWRWLMAVQNHLCSGTHDQKGNRKR